MAHKLVAMFVRHGSTQLNDQDKFRGPLDVDLDDNGKKQAKEVAGQLKGHSFGPAFVSSKKRTKQTADIALPGKKTKTVKDFDPLDVGEFAGKPKNQENLKAIEHYQDNPDEDIPGGESINSFRKRVNPKIKMAIKRGEEGSRPSISFVHSSIIHQVGHLLHGDHNAVKVKPGGTVGIFKSPMGYTARAITKKSDSPEDKHLVS